MARTEPRRRFDAAAELASRLHANLHMISVEEDLPRYAETMLEVDEEKEVEDTYFGQLASLGNSASSPPELTVNAIEVHRNAGTIKPDLQGGYYCLS